MGFEFSGIDELIQRLDEAEKKVPGARDKFLAWEAELVRGDAVDLTPVDSGNLQIGWKKTNPNNGRIAIYNNVEYAAPVEFGHRLKNRKTKKWITTSGGKIKFVPGKHMLRDAVQQRQDSFAEDAEDILKELMP